jgi:hydroxyacylglutathione hydrolase
MFSIEAIPAFADNYIWMLLSEDRRNAVLVDPGDAGPVLEVLQLQRITPVAILITHHHYDHTAGIHQLVTAYHAPVYAPAKENVRCCLKPLKEGNDIIVEELAATFTVLEVPGHTWGHICYYGHEMLFCGDTLFTGGCGRVFEGTAADMFASLEKLAALPPSVQIYCAHEYTAANLAFAKLVEPDNPDLDERIEAVHVAREAGLPTVPAPLSLEKKTNPFLRCRQPAVVEAASRFSGRKLTPGEEVFAVIRQWKDSLN